ncbi:serine hydrolase [Litorivicinus lipolyticus]|uniref:Serine hydrolase n=1 Tax=Litorivicinus lipolyticus TaxID=418701 RepID=A0A5Q2QF79_9GAMM|nr:serine hydrolase [Litorivicinus lipolyticus]QGG80500.1 serine hydrolase [Litorivicinus lipolyticus]
MRKILLVVIAVTFYSNQVLADHPPKKMMRNIKAFSQLSVTGKLDSFDVNYFAYGETPNGETTSIADKKFDKILADKMNLAAIIIRDGDIIYERYASKREIDSNTPLTGMSMSKTAISASIGALLCGGKIRTLDDPARDYSPFLANTPYSDVSIRNILQMNSGVSMLGRSDEKKFNQKARGVQKFSGKADVRDAIKFYTSAAREAGTKMNYHSSDSLALSVLVEDIVKKPLAQYFQKTLYSQFSESGFMQWTADKSGTTVSYSDLTMTARDWANFGQFLLKQKKSDTCLGKFFNEGVSKSLNTGKKNGSRYGYQSWVFDVHSQPTMVLQGHGGQFLVLDEKTNTVLLTISVNENYKAGNLFSNIGKIAELLPQ